MVAKDPDGLVALLKRRPGRDDNSAGELKFVSGPVAGNNPIFDRLRIRGSCRKKEK